MDELRRDCLKCGQIKALKEFFRQKGCRYGRRPYCKACDRIVQSSPDYLRRKREGNKTPHRTETNLAYSKSDARKESLRKYAQTEKFRATQRRWVSANPGKKQALVNAYRHLLRERTPMWANQKYITLFYEIAQLEKERTGKQVDVDHIIPLRGKTVSGLHVEHNLQLMFKSDNSRKGNRMVLT